MKGVLLFDIETTGLKKETTQLYLVGCGFIDDAGVFTIRQWLTESALDERDVLEDFFEFSKNYDTLMHFNGDGFDIPYVEYKASYYGLDFDLGRFKNTDIYKEFKRVKKLLGLERANQKAAEAFLGISREDAMNGGALIPYYYEYEKSKSPEAERLLLLHNHDDVKGLLEIMPALNYGALARGCYKFIDLAKTGDSATFRLELEFPLPVPVEAGDRRMKLYAEDRLLEISLEAEDGEVKIPVSDRENYYYLPQEDMIVHKSVAQYVDKKFRQKAKKENCFLKIPLSGLDMQGNVFFEDAAGKIIAYFM